MTLKLPATIILLAALFFSAGQAANCHGAVLTFPFNDTLDSEEGGLSLQAVDPGDNEFVTRTIDGVSQRVYAMKDSTTEQAGLELDLSTLAGPATPYQIEMLFRFVPGAVTGFKRILDMSGGASDAGLYANAQKLVIVEETGPQLTPVTGLVSDKFAGSDFHRLVVENRVGEVSIFLNGSQVGFAPGGSGSPATAVSTSVLDLTGDPVRLFLDDGTESASSEIAMMQVQAGATPVPEPSSWIISGVLMVIGVCWHARRKRRAKAV